MSQPKPVITAIGSCRITNPLRQADQAGLIEFNPSRVYGYTHSSAEAVQQARFLLGDLDIPELARPLVMPNAQEAIDLQPVIRSDVYLVELASAKEARLGETLVQWNYVCRHFADFLSDRPRAQAFWRLARGDREDEKRAFLLGQPAYLHLPPEDQERLDNLTMRPARTSDVGRDIAWLQANLPDVAFVTHCNARTASGEPLQSRAAYIEMVVAELERASARYCDPSQAMALYGQENALKDQSGSLSHYTEDFEAVLFDIWWRDLIAPALTPARAIA